jgi:hypothetical protein
MIVENLDGVVIIRADEGKKITNSTRSFFADFIYLGKNDSPDNYEEVGREIWKHFVVEENPDVNELKSRTEDLQSSVSSLQKETSALNETQLMNGEIDNIIMEAITDSDEKHEALTDVMLCAIDEVFMMLDPLISVSEEVVMSMENSEQLSELLNKEVNKMVELYVVMVQRGLKTIEQVPARYREQVRELLANVE